MLQLKGELLVGGLVTVAIGLAVLIYSLSYHTSTTNVAVVSPISKPGISGIEKHNIPTDCWITIDQKVLNMTSFLKIHPGGEGAIIPYCGKDATAAFNQVGHSNRAVAMFANYLIGLVGK